MIVEEENEAKHEANIRARAVTKIKAKKKADLGAATKTLAASSSFSRIQIDLPGLDQINDNLMVLYDVTEKLILKVETSGKNTISAVQTSIQSSNPDLSSIRADILNMIEAQNWMIKAQDK